jgi:hypothetical protein
MPDRLRLVFVACLLATGCVDAYDDLAPPPDCRADEELHPVSGTLDVQSDDFTDRLPFFVDSERPGTVHLTACGNDDFETYWFGEFFIGVQPTTPLPAAFEKGNPNAATAGAFFMSCPNGDCDAGERHWYNYTPQIDRAELDGMLEVLDASVGRLRGAVTIRQILDTPANEGTTRVVADFSWTPHEPR